MISLSRQRAFAAGLGALMCVLSLTACSSRGASGSEIGIAVALNPQRAGMQTIYNGVQLAVEQLNASSGKQLGGRTLVMVRGAADVNDPVKIADTFRDDRRVVGVVGHPESGTTLAAIDEYADTKNDGKNAVVAISPTGTSPALTKASRWLFRVCPSDVQSSRAVANFLLDSLHAMRAAIIYRNDSYGKDWAKSFAETYQTRKGSIVQRDPYLQGVTPWYAYAGYLKALKPDVLLFPGSQEDALVLLRAMRDVGVSVPLIGGDATSGLEDYAKEFPDVRYTAFFLARRAESLEAKAFVAAYLERFKTEPDQRAALAYDAAMLIGRGVLEVGPDRAKIRDYVESIGAAGKRPAFRGASGPLAFDTGHDPIDKSVVITRVGQ
jgi:branched-chain amino acid transport system substrate-binding protein